MRTDDLVQALVADRATAAPPLGSQFAWALGAGLVLSAAGFLLVLGPRPDIAGAMGTVRFDIKLVEVLLLAATAFSLVLQVGRPMAVRGRRLAALAIAPVLLLVAVAAELWVVPADQWLVRLVGTNSRVCLTAIPLMALPLLAAFMVVLRRGAPASGAVAGAVAGLAASGLAAVLYATHCPDDSPLFVAVWYPIAIGGVTLAGALMGRVILRW
ncbi:MAG TPA: NrsF family protein [Pseudolabrys sp.]|nr:NrsF family protein [Pseudolabrys sp.]